MLRDDVDLTQLREHLLEAVAETMQPVHVSLWLLMEPHVARKDMLVGQGRDGDR